ncbi:head maturation protease [Mycobacterium phage Enkosi]|uniref:MuF-like minor capsid protein n=1 Tax=Mycobacterium phage Amelie TaxID=1913035 RepID=A0A1J0GPV1_9CAUD|nr:head maturation protease [Mycobacterium phage Enkosi]YP_009952524.1 head maturation protease [Mycobacterium phage Amelie]ALF01383.1 MuF-like minor capsid protein [Mycobacterium phage Enkosi]APC43606.1 MuF-like minor capsid protein [Mycobacterium phage Amelie]AXC37112.1 MuF-like minor capsid protein [Mycobacterium phage Biglebops]
MTEPKAVPEFQRALVRLSDEAGGTVDRLVPRLSGLTRSEGLSLITDVYPAMADPFLRASGELTAQWYSEQPPANLPVLQVAGAKALAPAKAFVPEVAPLPARSQLAASGRWALLQRDPVNALRGSLTRSVFDQSRRTVLDNADREGVKWARYASANACGFCRMLATRALTEGSRGAPGLYKTKAAASRNPHPLIRGHDHCKCLAVPVRSGGYSPPEYVHDWLADYEAVSRDDDGNLLPEWTIARRMEQRADERLSRTKRKPGRPRKPEQPVAPETHTVREAAHAAQHLVETGNARADALGAIAREHVLTAQQVITRTDEIVGTAAHVTSRVKVVTDAADKVLGGAFPLVRDVKRVVDAADKALGSAAQVTGGARQVADAVGATIDATVQVAHGAKQIADEVRSVVDEVALVATGVRALFDETHNAVRDTVRDTRKVRSLSELTEQIGAAADTAAHIRADGLALVERAKGVVEQSQGVAAGVREIPELLRKPIAEAQELAQSVAGVAGDTGQLAADLQDVARSLSQLATAAADEDTRRFVRQTVDDLSRIVADLFKPPEAPRTPVQVMSERLDVPGARVLGTGGSEPVPAIAARVGLKPIDAAPTLEAIEGLPPMRALEAAPPRAATADVVEVEVVDLVEAPPVDAPAAPKRAKRTMDEVEAELAAAIEAGDDELIERLADELEKLEEAERKRAEKAAAKEAAKRAAEQEKVDRMLALMEEGWDPAEAEAEVYGRSVEFIRRRDFMAQARAEGHEGKSFDELLGWVFEQRIAEDYERAEAATNGVMLKKQYMLKVDPRKLWTLNEVTARKYMSEEMAAWFDENGRITRAALKEAILSGRSWKKSALTEDFLQ